jgi:hypothetical protein
MVNWTIDSHLVLFLMAEMSDLMNIEKYEILRSFKISLLEERFLNELVLNKFERFKK